MIKDLDLDYHLNNLIKSTSEEIRKEARKIIKNSINFEITTQEYLLNFLINP